MVRKYIGENLMAKVSRKISSNSLLRVLCESYADDPQGLGEDMNIYAERGLSLKEIVEEMLSDCEEDVTT